ncbi:hypothetical protein FHU23_003544 [Clostridium saccharobutylicum]|uniref:Uncharacterized protein n=1 Tax=Clostridium saccharobutylicum DSM 13864 TaxID=1345695 RepID=U5MR12_CLOSA|nr:hypothetical protein [Clostridium saccharobutylicum]AGX43244.1 hypothetical protein CLSA_c22690 [Clostridium saccharobutylicum DSM 13864]MBA2906912.1 hypothetical protein [Clostridium saccharobutylicum]MBA8791417.1 hypothetical protein [Clostridium saccharobutylicum]MBA8898151.1 hypothetical protein [Clostridium saccharobutylicum]MBA8980521.1 hypothetical protein [Clostridium saccharobutylicum]
MLDTVYPIVYMDAVDFKVRGEHRIYKTDTEEISLGQLDELKKR